MLLWVLMWTALIGRAAVQAAHPMGGEVMMAEVVTMDQRDHHSPFHQALMKATITLRVKSEDVPRSGITGQ